MPQEFQVLQCYQCSTFQVHQVKKSTKWNCKLCGEKQSIKKVFGRGSGADCRHHVQKLNSLRADIDNMEAKQQQTAHCQDERDTESCLAQTSPIQSVSNMSERWSKFVDKQADYDEEDYDKPLDKNDIYFVTDRRQFNDFNKSINRTRNRKRKKDVLCNDDGIRPQKSYMSEFVESFLPSAENHTVAGHQQFLEGQGRFMDRHVSSIKTINSDSDECISNFSRWGQFAKVSDENDSKSCSIIGQGYSKVQNQRNSQDFSWNRIPGSEVSKWGKYADNKNDDYNNDDDDTLNVDKNYSAFNCGMKTERSTNSECHVNIDPDKIKYQKSFAVNSSNADNNWHKLKGVLLPSEINITGNNWEGYGDIEDSSHSVKARVTNIQGKCETVVVNFPKDFLNRKYKTAAVSVSNNSPNIASLRHDRVTNDVNSSKHTGDTDICGNDNAAHPFVDRRARNTFNANNAGTPSDVSNTDRPLFNIGDITEEDLQL